MRALQAYSDVASIPRDEFVRKHPHPFIVFTGGPLRSIDRNVTLGQTVDRMVVEGDRALVQRRIGDTFLAAELVPVDADNLITIGLSTSCAIAIDDQSLSKQHAWFERCANDSWRIWDNDSLAGTQVNDEPVVPGVPRTLASGDKITLGYVDVTFLMPEAFYRLIVGLLR